jgi:hypothetical protein
MTPPHHHLSPALESEDAMDLVVEDRDDSGRGNLRKVYGDSEDHVISTTPPEDDDAPIRPTVDPPYSVSRAAAVDNAQARSATNRYGHGIADDGGAGYGSPSPLANARASSDSADQRNVTERPLYERVDSHVPTTNNNRTTMTTYNHDLDLDDDNPWV